MLFGQSAQRRVRTYTWRQYYDAFVAKFVLRARTARTSNGRLGLEADVWCTVP